MSPIYSGGFDDETESPASPLPRPSQVKANLSVGKINVFIGIGKIEETEKTAIVNPVNELLENKSAYSIDLMEKAGKSVYNEFENYKKAKGSKETVGSAFITKAGNINAKFIVHLVCPECVNADPKELRALAKAVYSL